MFLKGGYTGLPLNTLLCKVTIIYFQLTLMLLSCNPADQQMFWQCLVEFKSPFQSSNICIYPLRNRNVPGFDSFGDGDAGDG